MNMMKRDNTKMLITTVAFMVLMPSMYGLAQTVIFSESFEDPVVSDDSGVNPAGWDVVEGHPGYIGIYTNGWKSVQTPYGNQFLSTYRNKDYATTSSNILSEVIEVGATYKLMFHACGPSGYVGDFKAALLAIDSVGGETELAAVVDVTTLTTDMSYSNSLEVVAQSNAGERLAIRLRHNPDYTTYQTAPKWDNIILTVTPAPPSGTVITIK